MKKVPIQTIYYKDAIKDEFSGIHRNTKTIDETYQYSNQNIIWRVLSGIVYWGFAIPIGAIYLKCKFSLKMINKEVIKNSHSKGYFLFGNHTQVPGDGFLQALITYPQKGYVIVNADNVSLKGTEQLMLMIGALPLPTSLQGYKNFMQALHKRAETNHPIVIFPEAHIWPYYTEIRPFPSTAFKYPIIEKKDVFSFTVTYYKRKLRKTPGIRVYIDGPFQVDSTVSAKIAEKKLRDEVYHTMVKRAETSTYKYIEYIKKEEETVNESNVLRK